MLQPHPFLSPVNRQEVKGATDWGITTRQQLNNIPLETFDL